MIVAEHAHGLGHEQRVSHHDVRRETGEDSDVGNCGGGGEALRAVPVVELERRADDPGAEGEGGCVDLLTLFSAWGRVICPLVVAGPPIRVRANVYL